MELYFFIDEHLFNFNCNRDKSNKKLENVNNKKIGGVIVVPSSVTLLPFIGNKISLAP